MHVRKLLAASVCLAFAAPAFAQTPTPKAAPGVDRGSYHSALFNPAEELPANLSSHTEAAMQASSPAENLLAGPRIWASADYLLWYITPMNTPDLIQSVPGRAAVNSVQQNAILPGSAATRIFPDGRQVQFGGFNGIRGSMGAYLDPASRFGVDASVFILETKIQKGSAFNNGTPDAIAQQYFNVQSGRPISLFASLEGTSAGGIVSHVESATWGADANVRMQAYTLVADRNDLLFGVRYFSLAESIQTEARSFFARTGGAVGIQDTVRTRNQYYGGQVGVASRLGACNRGLGIDAGLKFGMGGVRQEAQIFGSNTFLSAAGVADTQLQGLFARPFNQGSFSRNKFAVLTDLNLNLTYNFTPAAKVYFGYNVMWVSSVIRPGEVIDPIINDSRARFVANPTPSTADRPAFSWNANDMWVQGMTFGVNLAY